MLKMVLHPKSYLDLIHRFFLFSLNCLPENCVFFACSYGIEILKFFVSGT